MVHWLRNNKYASIVLLLIRLYLGYQWLLDGFAKLWGNESPFNAQGFMIGVTKNPVLGPEKQVLYPVYNAFIKSIALPHAGLFSFMVAWGEFLIGIGLLLGVLTTAAAFFALFLNFMYLFAGTVSSNPLYVLLGSILLYSGFNAGKIGGDYWVIPYIRSYYGKWFHKAGGNVVAGGVVHN
ncbi:DoxX family protein [Sporolactobacillus spathodeae]|uniref:Thiosulfate dehydrogenase [quinone] large subunit n=1 Tax=Sporolactobacillus spathodeae TaxID=1465502 RepID=A0ABS2Q8E8_9BACL|nr:DoxX family protein [Sporolactobacillus spathodeae]MBM7658056.1 thiosulfate dehydrogenase [quinone] large subunit [Sporolactobacillus spathodeae]